MRFPMDVTIDLTYHDERNPGDDPADVGELDSRYWDIRDDGTPSAT